MARDGCCELLGSASWQVPAILMHIWKIVYARHLMLVSGAHVEQSVRARNLAVLWQSSTC
jgi:hypothetical protein